MAPVNQTHITHTQQIDLRSKDEIKEDQDPLLTRDVHVIDYFRQGDRLMVWLCGMGMLCYCRGTMTMCYIGGDGGVLWYQE